MFRAITCFLVVSCFTVLLYFYLDLPVAYWMKQHAVKLMPLCHLIYLVFNGAVVLPLIFVVYLGANLLKILKHKQDWLFQLLLALVMAQGFLAVAKILIGRARPHQVLLQGYQAFEPLHFNNAFFSFPSGHTLNIMLIAGFLGLQFTQRKYWFILLGLVISFFRVVGLDHFVSDWVFSVYLAYLIFSFTQYLVKKYPDFFLYSQG